MAPRRLKFDSASLLGAAAANAMIGASPIPAPTNLALLPASHTGGLAADVTTDTTPTITGDGYYSPVGGGGQITLYNGTTQIGTGVVTVDNTWSVTSTALAAGVHDITAVEGAGYYFYGGSGLNFNGSSNSTVLEITIVVAAVAPAAPTALTLAPASDSGVAGDDITKVTTPAITGHGIAGETITLYDGTIDVGTGTVTAGGTWSITTSSLTAGVQSFTATQNDSTGSLSAASAALSVTIDTTVPAAPTQLTLAPASDSGTLGDDITNVTTPVITGHGIAGETITLYDGTIDVGTGTVTVGGTWSITTSTLAAGVQSFTATQTDVAGNVSAASAALSVTIDTTVPAAPTQLTLAPASDSGTLGDDITNVTTPVITGTGIAGETITLYDGTIDVGTGTVSVGGTWSITTGTLDLGAQAFTATQTDVAGNVSAASTALTVTIVAGPTAPTGLTLDPASDSGVAGDDITNVTTPDITGTGIAGETITLYDGTIDVGTGTVAVGGTWSITTGTLTAGVQSFTAIQNDFGGNLSAASIPLGVTIDVTAPPSPTLALAVGSDSGTLGDDITNVAAPELTGTGVSGETITLYDGTVDLGTTVVSNGTWSIISGTTLPQGLDGLSATQTDVAGNISPAVTLALTIDAVAPLAPVITGLAAGSDSGTLGDGITDDTVPFLTGTAEAYGSVVLLNGGLFLGEGTADASGNWSIQIAPTHQYGGIGLDNGSYAITAVTEDAAANISPTSSPYALTIADAYIAVASAAQFGAAMALVSYGTEGSTTIALTQNISEPDGYVYAPNGTTLLIDGGGHALDDGGSQRGLDVEGGDVTLQNLTIQNAEVQGGSGGAGTGGGGGGGGGGTEGAGLFVDYNPYTPVSVALNNVTFASDAVLGGAGGDGGAGTGGGGGGGGDDRFSGQSGGAGGTGADDYNNYGNGGTSGHPDGYAGYPGGDSGGGGGFGGGIASPTSGSGAAGGFGAGGGGGGQSEVGGTGGFGGGNGGDGVSGQGGGGGGGLAAGGDIFIVAGATLLLEGGVISAGTVVGGAGAEVGGAYGSSIFLQGNQAQTLAPTLGQTLIIQGGIADQSGSGGTGDTAGSGALVMNGAGTIVLDGVDTYTGGSVLASGTLVLGAPAAAGSGAITFAGTAALDFTTADLPANTILGFTFGDSIDVTDLLTTATQVFGTDVIGGTLTIPNGGAGLVVTLDPGADYSADVFRLIADGNGGTTVTLALAPPAPALILDPGSDSGLLGDGLTNIATPNLSGTGIAGETITLNNGTIDVASGTVDGSGNWLLSAGSLADGVYDFTATQTDAAGDISAASLVQTVTIDTSTPPPPTLLLDGGSDSGSHGDGITNVSQPQIDGTGITGETITLYSGTVDLGTATVDGNGNWSIALATTLPDGADPLTATQTDAADTVSSAATLALTIDTIAPLAPIITGLDVGSDTGALGDGITSDTAPFIDGTAEPYSTVVLLDGSLFLGEGVADAGGNWSIAANPNFNGIYGLDDGTYPITAVAIDAAGNTSPTATPYALTVADAYTAVATTAQFNAALELVYRATEGSYTIALTQNITEDEGYALAPPGTTLLIDGGGFALSGGDANLVLFVGPGNVTLENLAINDGHVAAGNGGAGTGGGGGGGGGDAVGAGLIVLNDAELPANLTLNNVTFSNDTALGGAGGAGSSGSDGGGGGGGATFGSGGSGAAGGHGGENYHHDGQGGTANHPDGYPGSANPFSYGSGGGGGYGGSDGGGGSGSGGMGNFGGGGGGGGQDNVGGSGGFGGGHGGANGGSGGGGLAAGGDIYIAAGAVVTLEGGIISAGTVVGGAGAQTGGAFGSSIFLTGNQSQTLAPALGQSLIIQGGIADQSGSGGTGDTAGSGTLVMNGAGTIVLDGVDTYTGGSVLASGTLVLGAPAAAGSGAITFTGTAALDFATADLPANVIDGFTFGDSIDVTDLLTSAKFVAGSAIIGGLLDIPFGAGTLVVTLDPTANYAADDFRLTADGTGGTVISLGIAPPSPTGLTLSPGSDSGVAGDDITRVTTPTITGSGIAGETITLYDGAILVGSGSVGSLGSWSIVTTTLTAGAQTFTAIQGDGLGDFSAASSPLSVTIDTAVPAAPGLILASASDSGVLGDDITNVTAPAITGTGTAGDTITLYDGSIDLGTAIVGSLGTWSITTGTLAPGVQAFTATQTDIAANISAPSDLLSVAIDTALPTVPGLALAPASDSGVLGDAITTVTAPTITGTGIAGDTISLYDGDINLGTAIVGSLGTWSVGTGTLALGSQTLTATQTDLVGNVSAASSALALTIVAPPAAPAVLALSAASDSGVLGDDITNVTTPAITGTGSAGDTITLYDGSIDLGTAIVGSLGTWSITTGTLTPGVQAFTATQTDIAANISAPSVLLSVAIDTALPTVPGLALAPASDSGVLGDAITTVTAPTITGTGIAGDTISLYDGDIDLGTALVGSLGTWSVGTGTLALGSQTLTATQTDLVGNVSAASSALALTIVAPPAAPAVLALSAASDSGVLGDHITSITTPVITGTGAAGDSVTLYDGTAVVGTAVVAVNGTWSVGTAPLALGSQTMTATQTDTAGDVSAASSPLALTLVGISPAPTLALSPASDSGFLGDHISDIATPAITGTGTPGNTVTLYDGATAVGTGLVAAGGTWSITSSALALGSRSLTATQTDVVGDVSPVSSPLALTIVAAPAAATSLALAPASDSGTLLDGITDVTTPAITGTGTAGDTVTLYDGATAVGSAVVAANGTWSVTTPALALGSQSLTAKQTDPAGDVSAASSLLALTIVAGPAAPAGLTLSPASDSGTLLDRITDVTTPAITGTGTAGDTVSLYDGSVAVGTAVVAANGTWSITTTALALGSQSLTAKQTDPAGDVSAASSPLALTIVAGPAAPAGLTLSPGSDSGTLLDRITDVVTPAITGTGTAGDTVTLFDGRVPVGTAVVAANGTWSITTGTLTPGGQTLTATQTDSAGDVSAASTALALTIVAVPAAPAALTLSGTAITGLGTAGDSVILYDGTAVVGSAVVGAGGAWSITATLPQGAQTLTATETDPGGDVSALSVGLALTIGNVAPAAPVSLTLVPASDSGIAGDDITNVALPVITGLAAAGSTVRLYDGSVLIGSGTAGANGAWSITATTALTTGVNALTATASNASATSIASAVLAVTLDMAPPAAPTLGEAVLVTDPSRPAISGAAEVGSTVLLYQGGSEIDSTTATNGTWSFTYTNPLSAGSYVVTATATDAAGNVSPLSLPLNLQVNANASYAVVVPVAGTDTDTDYDYNSTGDLNTVQTTTTTGQVLTTVTNTSAVINIYDTNGKLIGTITQPSTSAFSQPVFATTPQTLAASTGSGPIGSVVNLLSETNNFVSQGNDVITVQTGTATITAAGPTTVVNNVAATVTFYGGGGTTAVYGGSGTVVAVGGAAGGTLVGGSAGGNVLVANGTATTLVGGGSGDALFGSTTGTDMMFTGTGSETLIGGGGTSTLVAADGTQAMWGGSGSTTIWAGSGQDVLAGNAAAGSTTTMVGGTGNDLFLGIGGVSTVYGGTANDTVYTGAGRMTAFLGAGQDVVLLGSGSATITGGTGADIYALVNGFSGGNDIISGFKVGTDHIDLNGYGANPVQQSVVGGNLVLSLTDKSTVTLIGITKLAASSIV